MAIPDTILPFSGTPSPGKRITGMASSPVSSNALPPIGNSPSASKDDQCTAGSDRSLQKLPDGPRTAEAISQGRLPLSAFAAQMIDQWSDIEDDGLYLVRERIYTAEARRIKSQPKVEA